MRVTLRGGGLSVLALLAASLIFLSPVEAASVGCQKLGVACKTANAGKRNAPVLAKPAPQAVLPSPPEIAPGAGQTVHDDIEHVTWLANGNLAATETFGVAAINKDGSMDYATALKWIAAMNKYDRGAGYLGHTNWTLPTTPTNDPGCNARNINTFGYNCTGSALGGLYYKSLRLTEPDTAVPMLPNKKGPFRNFQPYLYWSASGAAGHPKNVNGYSSFSFETGFHGSNVDQHNLYVLPMIAHALTGTTAATGTALQPSPDGQTVYDPNLKITWLADADLAAAEQFDVGGINRDGSMSHTTALAWIKAMREHKYLGQGDWELPPTIEPDGHCTLGQKAGFNCDGSPMGALFYDRLGLHKGEPAVTPPDVKSGAFHDIQPYLYWSCTGATGQSRCGQPPAPKFGWSFSFGSGFEGTDLAINDLFVLPYYPDPVSPTPRPAPPRPCGTRCL